MTALGIADLAAVLPALVLCLFGLAALMVGIFFRSGPQMSGWLVSVGLIIVVALCLVSLGEGKALLGFGGTAVTDDLTYAFLMPCALAGILTILLSLRYIRNLPSGGGEYCALVALATLGMAVMLGADSLIVGFFGLETLSVALYVLTGYSRDCPRSSEAAIKYMLIGSFASATMAYGIALVYTTYGTLSMTAIGTALSEGHGPPVSATATLPAVGLALLVVGLCFKAAVAPFHMWCPDVYQGAPTPVTAFLSVGPKVAAMGLLLRILIVAFGPMATLWTPALAVLAAVTMTAGNVGALRQTHAKRMLAYSGIAHAGYMLLPIVAAGALAARSDGGWAYAGVALAYYGLAYAFAGVGAFAVVSLLNQTDRNDVPLVCFRGLGWKQPEAGVGLAVVMVSLTGLPLTAGFIGKAVLFAEAIRAGYVWLVIVAALNTVASAVYYMKPVALAYTEREDDAARSAWAPTKGAAWVLAASVVAILGLALVPGPLLAAAEGIGVALSR